MITKTSVENFLSQKNIDVSRNPKKFGNTIYRSLKKKGYSVFPISPNAEKVVLKVHQAGIEKVWMQQVCQSDEAIKYCKENGVDFISNECILMFVETAGFIHRAHRWIWGVVGKLPR